jgi:hypothetical protein
LALSASNHAGIKPRCSLGRAGTATGTNNPEGYMQTLLSTHLRADKVKVGQYVKVNPITYLQVGDIEVARVNPKTRLRFGFTNGMYEYRNNDETLVVLIAEGK